MIFHFTKNSTFTTLTCLAISDLLIDAFPIFDDYKNNFNRIDFWGNKNVFIKCLNKSIKLYIKISVNVLDQSEVSPSKLIVHRGRRPSTRLAVAALFRLLPTVSDGLARLSRRSGAARGILEHNRRAGGLRVLA